MSNSKAVQEALENARIVALARGESVPDTRPPGESLYNVVVIAAEHELEPNPDFRPSDLPDDFREAVAFYEALPEGQRAFKMKTEETPYERTVFAPDAAEACERAEDVVAWEFSPDEWCAVSVAPV
ncbi:MAG: hypothetical protein V3S91_03345 [Gemmatimonadota bacterium]